MSKMYGTSLGYHWDDIPIYLQKLLRDPTSQGTCQVFVGEIYLIFIGNIRN
jgi:hypothetical protein